MNDNYKRIREELIASLPNYENPGPDFAQTIYLWPTAVCPIGCDHCNFASPAVSKDPTRNLVAKNPERVLRFVSQTGCQKLFIAGGGEPMVEAGYVYDLIKRVETSSLKEIELITSAFFGKSIKKCEEVLDSLLKAIQDRGDDVTLTLRLSVDLFHREKISLLPITHLLELIQLPKYSQIRVYIRSVLLENDLTIKDLATSLGASLVKVDDYLEKMELPNGREVIVYYKNLIIDGRMEWEKVEKLEYKPGEKNKASVFKSRFLNKDGKHIPARTYNGPVVEFLDGVALSLEHDCTVKILEGTSPDRILSLLDYDFKECMEYMYKDPLTIFLIEEGPQRLAELVSEFDPKAVEITDNTNQLYYIADRILSTPLKRLVTTLKVLEYHLTTGRISIKDKTEINKLIKKYLSKEQVVELKLVS